MRRWSKRILIALVLLVGAPTAFYFYMSWQGERELRETIAELDESDPGWRWADVIASRKLPAENNDMRVAVLQARAKIPMGLLTKKTFEKALDRPPNLFIPPIEFEAFHEDMQTATEALAEIRTILRMPEGRFFMPWTNDPLAGNLNDVQLARDFVYLCQGAAAWQAQQGDLDAALETCLAIQNIGQSLGEEPGLMSHLIRMAFQSMGQGCAERVLAQGQPAPALLEQLQKTYDEFDRERALLFAFRGERAWSHAIFDALAQGKMSLQEMAGVRRGSRFWDAGADLFLRSNLKQSHAWTLRHWSQAQESLDYPDPARAGRHRELEQEVRKAPHMARLLMPAFLKVYEAHTRTEARTRCAIAALACERFRRANDRWPQSLAELCPKYLAQVPADPCTGLELQLRPTADGIVIHSVGPDGKGRGAYRDDPDTHQAHASYEFRLWNVPQRRQIDLRKP